MTLVYLFIGLGVGILLGFMLGDRSRQGKPDEPTEFARLLKQATNDLDKDESVSITLVAGKGSDEDGGGFPEAPPSIEQRMLDKWREN